MLVSRELKANKTDLAKRIPEEDKRLLVRDAFFTLKQCMVLNEDPADKPYLYNFK